ncbi:hypothetical protein B0A48_12052 [Cryoendolithus antarcticus]|uniref:NAD-dependent epimerase/dehydratase domain-containing protein n=1 Tax=Cryoendolithus antarcticus TaxID=1507870 RepID=A0A1V8STK7_9PEZI|nr:hypothetical protein B0A48_12052 [Cryoendolithus antarcticus]
MSSELILLTGASGHIGFRTLRFALEHGYRVRAVVRSQQKADAVQNNRALIKLKADSQLSFVEVPDFTIPNAFDKAVTDDVKYIIHCASPMPFSAPTTDHAYEEYIKPAVDSTLEVLRSAAKRPSVRRVVITSSCIGVIDLAAAFSDTGKVFTGDTRQPNMDGPFEPGTPSFVAYAAGKVNALNAAEEWMGKHQPHFDIIHLMPTYVLGRNDMCDSVAGMQLDSNSIPLNFMLGTEASPQPMAMVVNHIDDCARIHVEALAPRIEGNQSFMICYDCDSKPQWNDAKGIVEKHFPEAVKAGLLPCRGDVLSVPSILDSKKTVETFGDFKYTYEDAVFSLVNQYLELCEKESGHVNSLKD